MTGYIQVVTTIDDEALAKKIAEELVKRHLIACVHIVPITSVYWWEGKVQQDHEWSCTMKTRAELYPEVEKAVKAIHTYDTPEIIATAIVDGSEKYLQWITETTADPSL
ncbi:divalent-cation tolerance protein CutA [Tengunoibacter tsumagoiensis]|uniref:Divalent cation tolerance protein n=1 Tax=Tengunoibacter tsumagoiensis TaxID=2014871 RepID=A0A402A961_9CHLR|nr:divalent-cation tolerance protein CutA [Tengunoibacter tsumagoiensis]GCE15690.1 divalent cation tolerance protein [Tengunoibacter tsumagoiensis]